MPKGKPQRIEDILHSFRRYALGDIIHNRKKAISGFLLGLCFIDQLSCFYFKENSISDNWEDFVKKYFPVFKWINFIFCSPTILQKKTPCEDGPMD